MQPLRYSINGTLDGCCDYRAIIPDEELHRHATENPVRAGALLFGRVLDEMMKAAGQVPARTGVRPDWMPAWMISFAPTIDAKKKYVVSSARRRFTLRRPPVNYDVVHGTVLEDRRSVVRFLSGPWRVGPERS